MLLAGPSGAGKTLTTAKLTTRMVLADAPRDYRSQVFWEDPRSDVIDPLTVRAWLQPRQTARSLACWRGG